MGARWEFLTETSWAGQDVAGLTPLRFGRPVTEETVKTLGAVLTLPQANSIVLKGRIEQRHDVMKKDDNRPRPDWQPGRSKTDGLHGVVAVAAQCTPQPESILPLILAVVGTLF